jgi:hypothetical protein
VNPELFGITPDHLVTFGAALFTFLNTCILLVLNRRSKQNQERLNGTTARLIAEVEQRQRASRMLDELERRGLLDVLPATPARSSIESRQGP